MHTLYFMELMDMGRPNRMWKASFPRQRALSCMSGEREPSIHTLMNELCLHHKYSVTSCCLKHPLPLLSHSDGLCNLVLQIKINPSSPKLLLSGCFGAREMGYSTPRGQRNSKETA